jgi:hypothetical protein
MYLFMKKGSAFCTIIHLPTMFMALNKATQHLQGHFIGFIGYLTLKLDPTPILLPTQKTWQWVKEVVPRMGLLSLRFMGGRVAARGGVWTPAAKCERAKGHVPQLLYILLVLLILIWKELCPLMLHEVLAIMMNHLKETWATNDQGKA